MEKILIYGAGSLGTALGAFLAREGRDVTLCSRNRAHVQALRAYGARIEGAATLCQPVQAVMPEELEGGFALIVLLTKQLENAQTARFLQKYLAPDGLVITGQNGLPEPGLADILGEERVAGCPVAWGARWLAPGRVCLTAKPESFGFGLGGLPGLPEEKLLWARKLLGEECGAPLCEDILGLRWSKLMINAAFTGLGSCFGMHFGEVAEDPKARKLALLCVRECIGVCRAAGVKIAPMQGLNIEKIFGGKGLLKTALALALIPVAMRKHRATWPSMLQDMEKGKPCEIEAVNGVVCRWGERYGVATPVNERIVQTVLREQRGEIPWRRDNLRLFEEFL